MTSLEELGSAIAGTANKYGRSVVGLAGAHVIGSGVVYAEGLVLTNAHNVHGRGVELRIDGGKAKEAELAGIDIDADLAVIRTDTSDIEPIPWADSGAAVSIGDPVIGLANPGGQGLRATLGFVAATGRSFRGPRGRRISGGFEHTAPAPSGASGGPVIDLGGRLVGINTLRLRRGFYVATTADAEMRSLLESLESGEVKARRRIGVGLAPVEVSKRMRASLGLDDKTGLLVRMVEDEGPAARAGLREGDLLMRAGQKDLHRYEDLHEAIDQAGETLDLLVARVNEEMTVTVDLD